jgi:6,7-dimethyl-8-ribityllumazine synthase
MVKVLTGKIKSKGKKFAIVVSRFNDFITKRLLDACLEELVRLGVKKSEITIAWVPGSFEIPVTAMRLARKKSIHAVICLGAVIRGETLHFDLISRAASEGISEVSLAAGKPAIFGVITTDTLEQAYKRAGLKGENKGREAAVNAVEMVNLLDQI